ncbi:MAG: haloacid dehalogenase-like hydrolase [Gammaproteobacteria bacterium]|nr:haloacid dehalogenase-like hydrolase [Gammaproteobacteria bacterium]
MAVFDFDKTLTDRDTLFGFYRTAAGGDPLFGLKRVLLIAAGVLYKTGLVNNRTLKHVGIYLFLKGKTRDELEIAARRYCEQIELNDIYLNHYQKINGQKWIVSASPEIYLRHLFPGDQVAGTTFTFSGNKVMGLETNMFGQEKKRFLGEKGITHIHKLYTDSMADKSLMDISEDVYIVNKGHITQLK